MVHRLGGDSYATGGGATVQGLFVLGSVYCCDGVCVYAWGYCDHDWPGVHQWVCIDSYFRTMWIIISRHCAALGSEYGLNRYDVPKKGRMITDFIIAQSVKTRAAFMLFCGLIALCAAILETEMVLRRVYGVIGVG